MPEGILAVLRELEQADEQVDAALAEVDRLAGEVDSLRAKAEELDAFATRLPADREARAVELERASGEASAAQGILGEAEQSLRTAKPEALREAELFAMRARDRVSVAERRVVEAVTAAGALENRAGEVAIEVHELDARAQKLAAEIRGRPRIAGDAGTAPRPGLDGVEAWSEVARAALFVARGLLDAEREAVIRQANELGALALGEPLSAMGTAALARRVEQALS